jgi:hypothetical protein
MVESNRRTAKAKPTYKLYTLCVYLLSGPVPENCLGDQLSRTIQIRGDQTLKDLHRAIFRAFEREDDHLYEFNLGIGPSDRSAIYSLKNELFSMLSDEEKAGDVATTAIDSLGLAYGRAFGYIFDFGDEWIHQINVMAVEDIEKKGRYPKLVASVGKCPPQYADEQ